MLQEVPRKSIPRRKPDCIDHIQPFLTVDDKAIFHCFLWIKEDILVINYLQGYRPCKNTWRYSKVCKNDINSKFTPLLESYSDRIKLVRRYCQHNFIPTKKLYSTLHVCSVCGDKITTTLED